jgi:hypothetical protein
MNTKKTKTMTNNKQQTAVEWLFGQIPGACKSSKGAHDALEQAKEMEVMGKEMSYSDGYAEGYKRALEIVEWYIKNYISGMPQNHIGDTNKKVDE